MSWREFVGPVLIVIAVAAWTFPADLDAQTVRRTNVNVVAVGGQPVTSDPCETETKTYINISQTANTQLVGGTSLKRTYVCSLMVVADAAVSVSLVNGTGTTCGTGTAAVVGATTAANGMALGANGGFVLGSGISSVARTTADAANLCLFQSGGARVAGVLVTVAR